MFDCLLEEIKDSTGLCKYDMFELREIINIYCFEHNIIKDSAEWFYLIDSLWCEMDSFRKEFDSEEEFESNLF